MAHVTVYGRLLASHFQAGAEVPLSGEIFFTPRLMSHTEGVAVHLPATVQAVLDEQGASTVELLSGGWSWFCEPHLNLEGVPVRAVCFDFLPAPGVDRVNFADIVPVTDPVTGVPMLRGDDGVGVDATSLRVVGV